MIASALIFLSILVIVTICFLSFSKSKKPIILGSVLGVIHLALVLMLAFGIYRSSDGEACMGWLIFYGIDIPSSLLVMPINNACDAVLGQSAIRANYHIPFITFAVFGTLQYFLIGLGIGHIYRKLKK